MPRLTIRPVDLHDGDTGCGEEPSQARPIRTGAFHTDACNGTESTEPGQQFAFTFPRRAELSDAQQAADRIQRRRDVHLEVCVDTTP